MSFRGIIFDLDGTLLDTLEDLANAVNRVLQARGWPTHSLADYRRFIGDGAATLIARSLPPDRRDDTHVRTCLDAFRQEYRRNWNALTRPYDGVPELLDDLQARRMKMAILSNKPDDFVKLCVAGLLDKWTFQAVLGLRDGAAPKPDPGGALDIAAELQLAPAHIVYVGDSGIDMRTAVAAGMCPGGALWGFRSADELRECGARWLLQHPQDLLRHL